MKWLILITVLLAVANTQESNKNLSMSSLKKSFDDLSNFCAGKSLDFCSIENMVFAVAYLQKQIEIKEKEVERAKEEVRRKEKKLQQNRRQNKMMLQKLRQKQHLLDRHF